VKVISLLADLAQIDHQKVHAIGLNWITMPSPTLPIAVVILAEIPAEEAPVAVTMNFTLLNSQGEAVDVPLPPDGQLKRLKVSGAATAMRDANRDPWEPVRVPFVAQIGPSLPIPPGDYKFAITVSQAGGETITDELRFHVHG
jgi:hypothetical protein